MSARVVKAKELTIRDYVASLDLNPENVFYQRVVSNNVTTAGAQWQITSPNKRSLLLSYAEIEWLPQLNRLAAINGGAEAFAGVGDKISFKPILPFTNAMTSQTVSMNGNSLTISQPRRFSEPLARMCVGKGESVGCYESEWWDDCGGIYSPNRGAFDAYAGRVDKGLWQNEKAMTTKLQEVSTTANSRDPNSTLTGNGLIVSYQEPLFCPPFNPFAKVQHTIPSHLPWHQMSPMIPNIDRVEIDVQFNPDKLAAGTMYYRYALQGAADGNQREMQIGALNANLLLWWYEVPVSMSIPRTPMIQTWNIREFQETISGGNAVANGRNVVTSSNTSLLQLRSVPTLILVHGRRRQDVVNYVCASHVSDSDFYNTTAGGSSTSGGGPPGDGGAAPTSTHSLDTYMEILSMNVLLGDRPNVISTTFTQRQLYELTLRNSKYHDYSQNYVDWRGPMVQQVFFGTDGELAAGGSSGAQLQGTVQPQQAKSFCAFQPKDLAERISSGVFFPNSLQLEVLFRAKDGACGFQGGDHIYDIFTHILVGKHWLRIEPDRGQYQEQNVPLDTAERELQSRSSALLGLGGGGGRGSGYVSRF